MRAVPAVEDWPTICFFNRRYHSIYGAQSNLIRLAAAYGRCGEAIMLTTEAGLFQETCEAQGVQCDVLKTPPIFRSFGGAALKLRWWQKLGLVPTLCAYNWLVFQEVSRRRPAVVVLADAQSFPFFLMVAFFRRARTMVYVQADDTGWVLRGLLGLLAERILVIADCLRDSFTNTWPWSARRITTFYSGFPIPTQSNEREFRNRFCKQFGISDQELLVGLVGSLTSRKGGDLLVAAAGEILQHAPHCRFIFFGTESPGHEDFRAELESRIADSGRPDRFLFAGFHSAEVIYNTIDVLVLPSRSEGLPSVLIEAMGYGIPVVASDVAGAREIIRNEQLGWLVQREDVHGLAGAVIAALKSGDDAAKREQRRMLMERVFSEEAYQRRFLEIVREEPR